MAGLSDYAENALLDWICGEGALADITTHVALFTAAPSDAGGGTEVSGGSYARVATTPADWNAAASGAKDNANALTFPTATASWGTVTHFGLFDAASGGNLLAWAALSASKTVGSGDIARFAAGALDLTAD